MQTRADGTRRAAKAAAVLALAAVGCAACAPPIRQPSPRNCTAFGLLAIEHRQTVTTRPEACTGLSREQVNQAVASAIREAIGPLPKAAARRLAVRDSKYLAHLITTVPPQPPASLATQPAQSGGGRRLSLYALACWLLTATAGSYLLARLGGFARMRTFFGLRGSAGTRGCAGTRGSGRHRSSRAGASMFGIVAGHVAAAVACVGVLAAFAVTDIQVVAWIAVGLVALTAGLGLATLVTGLPEPGPGPGPATSLTAARRRQSLVAVVVTHGVLATVTILLVWLAAVAGS